MQEGYRMIPIYRDQLPKKIEDLREGWKGMSQEMREHMEAIILLNAEKNKHIEALRKMAS